MEKNNAHSGAALIFTAGALWGFVGVFVKQMSQNGSTPVFTAFLRVFFAFFIMFALTVYRYGIKAFKADRRTILCSALLGIVCHGIYNIFYSTAVTLSGVAVSAVLLNLAPIFTLAVSVAFLNERFTLIKAAAVAVNVAGCIMTASGGANEFGKLSALGILCGAGAGICYAMTAIFGKLVPKDANSFVISTYSYMFASAFLLAYMPFSHIGFYINSHIAAWGFALALIPTAIAYLLYYVGLQKINEGSKAPVIASVETAIAAILGVALYNEQLSVTGVAGILLVFVSIVLMNKN